MAEIEWAYGVEFNFASPNEHVPEAEVNNKVIKERVQAAFHWLPFTRLPIKLEEALVMEAARKLNFFPPKGGVSQ